MLSLGLRSCTLSSSCKDCISLYRNADCNHSIARGCRSKKSCQRVMVTGYLKELIYWGLLHLIRTLNKAQTLDCVLCCFPSCVFFEVCFVQVWFFWWYASSCILSHPFTFADCKMTSVACGWRSKNSRVRFFELKMGTFCTYFPCLKQTIA